MTTFETLLYAIDSHVLTITLNRPDKLNAVSDLMITELIAAFDAADADDDVRAIVVTGAGRVFCAGADLQSGGDAFRRSADDGSVPPDMGGTVALRIFASKKPVIGAINGAAVGFGATMTLPMDVRVAAEGARFGFVFTRRGIVPEAASSWFLPRITGIGPALEWTLTGRMVGAEEARAAGLVRSVHALDDLVWAATGIAREIADHAAPVSVALTRALMWRGLTLADPMDAHRIDSSVMHARGRSADVREGVTAFLEKRAPVWPGGVSHDMPPSYPWWSEPRCSPHTSLDKPLEFPYRAVCNEDVRMNARRSLKPASTRGNPSCVAGAATRQEGRARYARRRRCAGGSRHGDLRTCRARPCGKPDERRSGGMLRSGGG